MSNFRLLGKALIDFSRVRSVIPAESPNGLYVVYADGDMDFLKDEKPAETLKTAYERWLTEDGFNTCGECPDCGDEFPEIVGDN